MAIGTFLYPAIAEKTKDIQNAVKLNSNNTFTGTNTFNGVTNFHNAIYFKNTTNNNGAFLQNFDYNSENYTALKFTKNPSAAVLIFEVNYDRNTATISSPTTNNHLYINNLANPTSDNQAANKAYVDTRVFFLTKNNITFTRQTINTTAGNQVTKYYSNNIPYSGILPNCTNVISVTCSDIPVSGEHLVITWFPKRSGNNVLIEIYQYGSNNDIKSQLDRANFQFVIQKSV